jgi:trk system potassium uptake protein
MKLLLRYLGAICCISAFLRIIPIIIGVIYGEAVLSYWLSLVISIVIGGALMYMSYCGEQRENQISLARGLLLATLSFVVIPSIGSLSYLPYLDMNILDSLFESVSGYTTTGLTLFSSLDELPKSLLIWRALTQWMGGIGIVIVFLFLFSKLSNRGVSAIGEVEEQAKHTIALAQSQGMNEKMGGGIQQSVSSILFIYLFYTFLGFMALLFTGMPFIEAMGLSFTSLSTGGFSMGNSLYTSSIQGFILSLLMIIGSISFVTHNFLFVGNWKKFFYSFEKNIFLATLMGFIIIALIIHPSFSEVTFQLISAFTTTGFATTNLSLLPPLFLLLMMVGMMHGGCSASTSGGIKTNKIYYLLRAIPWSVKKLASPRKAIIPLIVHGIKIDEAKITNAGIHVFTYLLILLMGTITFMIFGYSFLDSSFQIFSALGTVGLQTIDLLALNALLKMVLIICMIFGRLEIFPLLILFRGVGMHIHKVSK